MVRTNALRNRGHGQDALSAATEASISPYPVGSGTTCKVPGARARSFRDAVGWPRDVRPYRIGGSIPTCEADALPRRSMKRR